MVDRQFLRIDDKWALACDDRQWILQKRHDRSGKEATWDGVSFVTSDRRILVRCMCEKGAPSEAAIAAYVQLPETFFEFRAQKARQINLEARHSAFGSSAGLG